MQVHPKKSREAHSQIGRLTLTAASSSPQHQDSPACDLRGPQPVPCRGDGAGQHSARFNNPKLNQIFLEPHPRFDGPAQRQIVIRPALPHWEIAVMALVALFIGVILATGGKL